MTTIIKQTQIITICHTTESQMKNTTDENIARNIQDTWATMGEQGITIITLGKRNGNQLREHNRDNNVNGSIRHQKAYHRMNDSYQHREENKDKTGVTAIVGRTVAYSMDYTGYRKIFSRHSTFRNRDDYTRRDDERGHYQSIHRDTHPGNRDVYQSMDKNRERDQVDYWRESDVYTDNRDNDRFQ